MLKVERRSRSCSDQNLQYACFPTLLLRTQVLTPQYNSNLSRTNDIFNHSNNHFWQYMQPGYDALGFISCTGTNFLVRANAYQVRVRQQALKLESKSGSSGCAAHLSQPTMDSVSSRQTCCCEGRRLTAWSGCNLFCCSD
jgi:hypothetical protein